MSEPTDGTFVLVMGDAARTLPHNATAERVMEAIESMWAELQRYEVQD
jgi:hypothetical protein